MQIVLARISQNELGDIWKNSEGGFSLSGEDTALK
jgi:hypothetical protein